MDSVNLKDQTPHIQPAITAYSLNLQNQKAEAAIKVEQPSGQPEQTQNVNPGDFSVDLTV